MDMRLSPVEFELVNSFQRGFPLMPRPFAAIAAELGMDEAEVIESLQRLHADGTVSRVGAVFRPNAIGVSVLAALAVPRERLCDVARYVSGFAEVNHNYEREHRFNLWFVITAPTTAWLGTVLADIEEVCECGPALVLPMLEDYHIDLGFDLAAEAGVNVGKGDCHGAGPARSLRASAVSLSGDEQILLAALQDGLPLVERPFACLGLAEAEALATIAHWLEAGIVRRFGIVVRHHELGYTANAMTVWDVPDAQVDEIGRRIAASGRVTLCYRRARQLPDWRYNLFCMIHGKDRADVEAQVDALSDACGLDAYARCMLFSRRRFKQRGARYAALPDASHGRD